MRMEDAIDSDIRQYLAQFDNLLPEDKHKLLKNLLDKYIHLSTTTFLMDKFDYNVIVSQSKHLYSNETFREYIGANKRRIYSSERANFCIIESTISYLASKDCLKRLPKFDYRDK